MNEELKYRLEEVMDLFDDPDDFAAALISVIPQEAMEEYLYELETRMQGQDREYDEEDADIDNEDSYGEDEEGNINY